MYCKAYVHEGRWIQLRTFDGGLKFVQSLQKTMVKRKHVMRHQLPMNHKSRLYNIHLEPKKPNKQCGQVNQKL